MKALFIANGISTGSGDEPGVSGGDIIVIKVAQRWKEVGLDVHFLTTPAGATLCEELGLDVRMHVLPGWSAPTARSAIARIYWSLTNFMSEISDSVPDIVLTSNEGLTDVVPAYRLKRALKTRLVWAAMLHFVPAYPWIRTKARRIDALLYYLNHYAGARIIRKHGDTCFAVSDQTASDYIEKFHFSPRKMYPVPAGVDVAEAKSAAVRSGERAIDGLFLKRLHPMKGVYDLVAIWESVVERLPDARLAVAGTGPDEVVRQLKRMITETHLEKNIKLLGPIYDVVRKYELVANSKVLLLPSYEENWAIVVGEALACGTPVVAYELRELRKVWGSYINYVDIGNRTRFAEEVTRIIAETVIHGPPNLQQASEYASSLDWDRIADGMLSTIFPPERLRGLLPLPLHSVSSKGLS